MTLIQKEEELTGKVPNHFEKTTVKINDKDVLAYQNKVLKLTIVAIKDSKGNINFYEYKNNNYKLYKQLTSGNISIHILDTKKIPKGYKPYKLKIDNNEYQAYKLNKSDSFFLIYGENVETGKKSLYNYDEVEKTIQRYNKVEVKSSNSNDKYLILGLLGLVLLLLLILLGLLSGNRKVKNKKKIRKRIGDKYNGEEKF